MLWPPLVLACFGAVLVFHLAKQRNKLGYVALALGFFFYIVFGFIGEFANHYLFPESFKGLGDNPSQIGHLIITIFFSFVIVPVLYKVVKKQKPVH